MCERCANPRYHAFDRYGGRGIKVHGTWRGPGGFVVFLADMGRKPTAKHTLERIAQSGNYEPGNCRWATHTEQMNNRSINRIITAFGRTQTLDQWCKETGIHRETICDRLARGATPEQAVTPGTRVITGTIGRPKRQGSTAFQPALTSAPMR
jgi:hypothetical protein